MSYKEITFQIKGDAPLLMHNGQLADPINRFTKELKEITSIRKKTEEDYEAAAIREFMGSLYLGGDGKPCIPGDNIIATLLKGAAKFKLATKARPAVLPSADDFPLIYDGPKDPEKLARTDKFVDRRGVKVGQSTVIRTRPRFDDWALDFALDVDTDLIEVRDILRSLVAAGQQVGLGDFRPRFGRFSVLGHG